MKKFDLKKAINENKATFDLKFNMEIQSLIKNLLTCRNS